VDVHVANRVIPCLLPLGLACLLLAPWLGGLGDGWALALVWLFVLLYGMGNGMVTIVKGTVIAQYVDRDHVASLNGALGVPTALARAVAPLMLGLLWTREAGYGHGLGVAGAECGGGGALLGAQRLALARALSQPSLLGQCGSVDLDHVAGGPAGWASCSKVLTEPSFILTLVTQTFLLVTFFWISLPITPPATAPPTVATVLPVPLPTWLPSRPPATAPPRRRACRPCPCAFPAGRSARCRRCRTA
jgi:hypothetical protein